MNLPGICALTATTIMATRLLAMAAFMRASVRLGGDCALEPVVLEARREDHGGVARGACITRKPFVCILSILSYMHVIYENILQYRVSHSARAAHVCSAEARNRARNTFSTVAKKQKTQTRVAASLRRCCGCET